MTVVELFAGAGGASLGLIEAGWEEARAVEWNHDACETRRAAGMRCDEGDVRDPAHYAGVQADAVWSSFPCQAWSTAGRRLGKDDPRNGWPWTVNVLDRVKPTWLIAENVPGLTHHRDGCNGRCVDNCARVYFEGTILADLRARFASVQWSILDAARFGVPQNRERLIIVAGPRPIEWPRETHAPPEDLIGLFETRRPWVTMRQALGEPKHPGGDPRFAIMREDPSRGWEAHGIDEPSSSVRAGRPGGGLGTRAGSRPELLDKPSPTVMAGNEYKTMRRASDALWLGAGIRRLTPAECATLQAFPPDHPWRGTKTSVYVQIGNAVPPPLARAVAVAVRTAHTTPRTTP